MEGQKRPPTDLKRAGKQLWRDVLSEFDDFQPQELRLLHEACRVSDRLEALHQVISSEGEMVVSKTTGEPRAHPAVVEARQLAITQARLFAAMRLPDADGLRPQNRQARGIYAARRLRGVS